MLAYSVINIYVGNKIRVFEVLISEVLWTVSSWMWNKSVSYLISVGWDHYHVQHMVLY